MSKEMKRWGLILVPLVSHKAIKVRENALSALMASLNLPQSCHKELVASLKQPMKQVMAVIWCSGLYV